MTKMAGDTPSGSGLSSLRDGAPSGSPPKASIPIAFVVMGATGEYPDHREWPVAAYLSEPDARAHAEAAGARARAIEIHGGANEYDADMITDYTGTIYFVLHVPLYHRFAQAGETRRAETGTGSVHEHAVGSADAPDPPSPPLHPPIPPS